MKAVRCIDTGIEYKSILAATQETGFKNLFNACHKGATAGGYKWEFVGYNRNYDIVTAKSFNKRYKAELQIARRLVDQAINEKYDPSWGMITSRKK